MGILVESKTRKRRLLANATITRTSVLVIAAMIGMYAAELSLPMTSGSPGSVLLLPVTFASQSGAAAGLQFDLQYDSSNLNLSITVGGATRSSGKTLSFSDLAQGRKRFLITGLNQNPLVDGALVNLSISLNPGASSGTYPLRILNVVGADPSAQALNLSYALCLTACWRAEL